MTVVGGVLAGERRNATAVAAFVLGLLAIAGGTTFLLGKALPPDTAFAAVQAILAGAPALWLLVVVLAVVLGHVGLARSRRLGAGRGLSIAALVLGYVALLPAAFSAWTTASSLALWGPYFGLLR